MKENLKVVISGGGTGGHIFPAIAIADALKRRFPKADILFIGAQGRMEMERVPKAGYEIVGLPIMGFDRKNLLKKVFGKEGNADEFDDEVGNIGHKTLKL